jgi:hypothetical protein
VAVELMHGAGIAATQCDVTDLEMVQSVLDELDDVGALMILDVIEHLVEPQRLLSTLAAWSLKHHEAPLVVSVPNVAHFDLGVELLAGRWRPTENGLLDSTHLRFFTQETLERMFERCGWQVVARNDFEAIRSDQYDGDLHELLPLELVGALRTMADSLNPASAVQQFVWALRPFPVANPPESFLDAVSRHDDETGPVPATDPEVEIRRYLSGVGLLASEQSRRQANEVKRRRADEERRQQLADQARQSAPAEDLRSDYLPLWKQWALDAVYHSPRTSAAFMKLYRRLR